MEKIGLVIKNDREAIRKAKEFTTWLESKQMEVIQKAIVSPLNGTPEKKRQTAPKDLDCVFVLGGDGTFLSAARWIGNMKIPIVGVKFGEVGFLAEITEENLLSVADAIINGKFDTKSRMRLQIQVIRGETILADETILNDVVINKGALARLALIETYINGNFLTTYRADGLIVSTPTGSTAYSLAAGGPVIHPEVPGIIMTPICPFTLTNRPLIVPDSARITIRLEKGASDIMLTFDGQIGFDIDERDEIIICKAPYPVNIITIPGQNYFDVLKEKLRWSGGRG